jgi:hypothetical protein
MNSDDEADEVFLRHLLWIVQLFTFTIALCTMIVAGYDHELTGECDRGKNEVRVESGSGDSAGVAENVRSTN